MSFNPYQHKTTSGADIVYYDLVVANYKSEELDDNLQHLKFYETRQTPIIENASDYFMSIVKFQLDTFSLPVYYALIEPDQGDPTKMIYSFTTEYVYGTGASIYSQQRFCTWDPADMTKATPKAPNQTSNGFQEHSEYYYCYSYHHMVKILNDTLALCMGDLFSQYPVVKFLSPPFFAWNASNNTISLYGNSEVYNSENTTDVVNIYCNTSTYSLLNGMPVHKKGISNSLGRHYRFILDSNNGANLIVGNQEAYGTTDTLIKIDQEWSSIQLWTPVSSIVFTTSTLPITPNQVSAPMLIKNGEIVQLSSLANQSFNIITDMSTNEQSYKPSLLYIPSAEYRLINLYNETPINQIDLQVYWRDKFGNLHPFKFPSGSSCSVKIAFIKKSIRS